MSISISETNYIGQVIATLYFWFCYGAIMILFAFTWDGVTMAKFRRRLYLARLDEALSSLSDLEADPE